MIGVAEAPRADLLLEALDLSGFESGLLLSAASLAIVAGSIPGGLAGDRLGSRRVTLTAGGPGTATTFVINSCSERSKAQTDGSRYSSTGVPMVTMTAAASSSTAGSVVALMSPARVASR